MAQWWDSTYGVENGVYTLCCLESRKGWQGVGDTCRCQVDSLSVIVLSGRAEQSARSGFASPWRRHRCLLYIFLPRLLILPTLDRTQEWGHRENITAPWMVFKPVRVFLKGVRCLFPPHSPKCLLWHLTRVPEYHKTPLTGLYRGQNTSYGHFMTVLTVSVYLNRYLCDTLLMNFIHF